MALFDLRGITNGKGDVFQNADIALEALEWSQAAGVERVFLPSSAAVYGRLGTGLSEDMAEPASDYGRSKLEMEVMAAQHAQASSCLRFGNLAGVDAILGGWRPGFELDQFEDGTTPARSYIGPESLVRVLKALATNEDLPPVLNVAAPDVVEMGALLDAAGLDWTARIAPETAIRRVALDTGLLETIVKLPDGAADAVGIVGEWRRMSGTQ